MSQCFLFIGVRPYLILPVGISVPADRHEGKGYEQGAPRGHKVYVAGISGCNNGLTEKHRFRHSTAVAFRSMKRQETIAASNEILDFVVRHFASQYSDVCGNLPQ